MRRFVLPFFVMLFVGTGSAYESMKVENGGTIHGKVTYTGKKIRPKKVNVSKDMETCGHEPRILPRVVTGEGGGLANAVVTLEGISKGKPFAERESPPVIDQKKCRFVPFIQVVRTGEKLIVRNSDPVLHNIQATQSAVTLFNQAQPFQGLEFENEIEKPGPVTLKCNAHSWMEGYLWASDHPYVSITDENGRFELNDVPPGEYTVRVWHPYLGEQSEAVQVGSGETVKKDFEYKKRIRKRRRKK